MFFFFKQKTAYEMRISDWSSDVCSSDLIERHLLVPFHSVVPIVGSWKRGAPVRQLPYPVQVFAGSTYSPIGPTVNSHWAFTPATDAPTLGTAFPAPRGGTAITVLGVKIGRAHV